MERTLKMGEHVRPGPAARGTRGEYEGGTKRDNQEASVGTKRELVKGAIVVCNQYEIEPRANGKVGGIESASNINLDVVIVDNSTLPCRSAHPMACPAILSRVKRSQALDV